MHILVVLSLVVWLSLISCGECNTYFNVIAGVAKQSDIDYCQYKNGCQLACINGTYPRGGYTCLNGNGILEVNTATKQVYDAISTVLSVHNIVDNRVDLQNGTVFFSFNISTSFPASILVPAIRVSMINEISKQGAAVDSSRVLVTYKSSVLAITFLLPASVVISIPANTPGDLSKFTLYFDEYYFNQTSLLVRELSRALDYQQSVLSIILIESLSVPQGGDAELLPRACSIANSLVEEHRDIVRDSGFVDAHFSGVTSTDSSCLIKGAIPQTPSPAPAQVPTPTIIPNPISSPQSAPSNPLNVETANELSTAAIVGIVIGSCAFVIVILIAVMVFLLCFKKKNPAASTTIAVPPLVTQNNQEQEEQTQSISHNQSNNQEQKQTDIT